MELGTSSLSRSKWKASAEILTSISRGLYHRSAELAHADWSRRQESNPQPTAYKAVALPIELRRRPSGKGSRTSFVGPLLAVHRAWLHGVVGPFASWRYVRTAVTRRLTDRSSDRPSFEKIVLMYFSTEDSDRWRASAIVGFDFAFCHFTQHVGRTREQEGDAEPATGHGAIFELWRTLVAEVGRKTDCGNPQQWPQQVLSLPGCSRLRVIPSLLASGPNGARLFEWRPGC